MTCAVQVSGGLVAYVDDEDAARIRRHTWTAIYRDDRRYAVTSIDGVLLLLHRVVLDYWGEGDVDHRNHNGLDCRKSNMFIVTRNLNSLNRRIVAGVKERLLVDGAKRYDSRVQFYDESFHLGTFRSYAAAHRMAMLNRRRLLDGRRPIAWKGGHRFAGKKVIQL